VKLKSGSFLQTFSISLMSLPTPSQSVSHKRLHQCVNHKKKLSLRHLLPTFGSFSFFQASLWLGVDKVLQKLKKSYKMSSDIYFNVASWFPVKVHIKPHFNTQCPTGQEMVISHLCDCLKVWNVLKKDCLFCQVFFPYRLVEVKVKFSESGFTFPLFLPKFWG